MQFCNMICYRTSVPRGDTKKDIYKTKVFCTTCQCYFTRPVPRLCVCCSTPVRNVKGGRGRHNTYDYSCGFSKPREKWIAKDILQAKREGRL